MSAKRSEEEAAARRAREAEVPDALHARPRRNVLAKVALGLLALALIMRVGIARRPDPPPLAASCTTPAFALSAHEVKQARPVTFTIVGPNERRYVLGVDTESFTHKPGGAAGYDAVPRPGREDEVLVPRVEPMKGCRSTGRFALPYQRLGEHTVTLYELRPEGSLFVAQQTITVVEP